MNADALLLYSYLMRQDIPFTRFCHPAYRDRTQWIQSLKKSKLEPVFSGVQSFRQHHRRLPADARYRHGNSFPAGILCSRRAGRITADL